MATTQTQDKVPGGLDITWDTIDGFMGFVPNFDITYLGRKELLMPIIGSTLPQLDLKGVGGIDQYYQRRNCYVIKAKYKRPITTNEFIFYLDPEIYYSCYMISKDRKGRDWLWNSYFWGRMSTWQISQAVMSFSDVQRIHSSRTSLCQYVLNIDYTAHDFSMDQLIKTYGTR